MTKYTTVFNTVRARVKAQIEDGAAGAAVPVAYPNAPFTRPATGPFVVLQLQPVRRAQPAIGERRVFGNALFTVAQPVDEGESGGFDVVDDICAAFTGVKDAGVQYETAECVASVRGAGGEAGYHLFTVSAGFFADETGL